MRVDDFVCLGRTVPEESKKYGHTVCMAGVSQELGTLMRVYPLPVRNPITSRTAWQLELRRNPQDSRKESWRLLEESKPVEAGTKKLKPAEILRLLEPHKAQSIKQLNDGRKSLGVIEPDGDIVGKLEERNGVHSPEQKTLFRICDDAFGAKAIHLIPKLQFYDSDGGHCLQLREWGCYEWMRNQRGMEREVFTNLKLKSDRRKLLVVGNMASVRNNWLVIAVFTFEADNQMALTFNS